MAALACGASGGDGSGIGNGNAGGTSSGGTAGTGNGGLINVGASSSSGAAGGILTEPPPCDAGDPNVDRDADGYTPNQGDCNDCAKQINPAAYDFPGNNVDEDCSMGGPDDEPTGCDATAPGVDYADPLSGAAAVGLCRMAQGESWGVISAQYVQANGTPGMNALSHGLVASLGGFSPREGARMLMLSSGTARAPGDNGYRPPVDPGNLLGGENMGTTCPTPPGFPVPAPACPNVHTQHDPRPTIQPRLRFRSRHRRTLTHSASTSRS